MGRTWRRRKDRRGNRIGNRKGFRRADRWQRSLLRVCCETISQEPHDPACRRSEAMCGEKVGYEARDRAQRAAATVAAKAGEPRRAYRCPDCGLYHLTSKV